ncbi:PTPLA-domain-containing protein [Annulohypoxylon truncatum]|uniref:PTPLA-domain-containing protein n=1 Tax=Annulohypoxylon truncatum TaxID=327061 RepID=UPI002007AB91|nr:PTPLA-domain-containing protein [Annulohypoxylon truncatum]KAI1213388.1 PTPLA-domain-containing protein [Annulohypoxylon truncatum]
MADTAKPTKKASPIKNGYLILYNAVSAVLWLTVLGRVVGANATGGPLLVYPTVGEFCKWTQTLAGMEVLHSILGVVRAPFFTTFMQVFSRYAIVWGVTGLFPELALGSDSGDTYSSLAYSSMLVAWATTEIIRYSYFALGLSSGGKPPYVLHWLRYHAFFILYPVGISSEAYLIWRAVEPAKEAVSPLYSTVLFGYVALVYPPSAYILYTHMMAQRRKVMKGTKTSDKKASK